MTGKSNRSGAELFIVDNSDEEWKVRDYLREWTGIANQFDIATGYFEIGSLLSIEGMWQKLDKIRILMGDEITKRTKKAMIAGIESIERTLDASLEYEKEKNEFLSGVPAIVEALQNQQIECRIYNKKKFHAKAYITHSKLTVVGSSALVGSSNFTYPGLTDNVELNVQLRREVELLQEWYERHWNEAVNITPEILKVIERHTRDYLPFEIYARALKEYFRRYEIEVSEWEKSQSRLYKKLDAYQQDGYKALMKIAAKYRGAFLCDGVGLGKTFVGMMLIERLVERDRKRVALFVPKATSEAVWKPALRKYLPNLFGRFSNLEIFSHTDLSRDRLQEDLRSVKERADVIIIDEAHNFRNPGLKGTTTRAASRYYRMAEIIGNKKVFLLTATPINNSLIDLQRLIELFTNKENNYFRNIGVHSLPAHFRYLEKQLEDSIRGKLPNQPVLDFNPAEAEQILGNSELFRELVVQRSRSYVRESQKLQGGNLAQFPKREVPQVAEYSIKKTYGKLLESINKAFSKKEPLFTLAIYSPTSFLKTGVEEEDIFLVERQKQLVGLIRTLFLKRFESSAEAFRSSCEMLYHKMLAFATRNAETAMEKAKLDRIKRRKEEQFGYFRQTQRALFDDQQDFGDSIEFTEDKISPELLESFDVLDREKYNVHAILNATFDDMDQILDFLDEFRTFEPKKDDKLQALIRLLKGDKVLKKHKVLIFSEYMQTAQYLFENLKKAGIDGVAEIDGTTKPKERFSIVRRFSPFYNDSSNDKLASNGEEQIRVLISTDVLAEGLNLQDATRLINYDLHWNPVRLMQRIGRVDRRLNNQIEEEIVKANPDQKEIRGTVVYWNFLPPDELDSLLNLYTRVSNKVLKISRVFGIEGKKLLKPEDDYEALKDFNHELDGDESPLERLHLEYQELLKQFPELDNQLSRLPNRIFSGKKLPDDSTRAVFFCYELPEMPKDSTPETPVETNGSDVDILQTVSRWYLYDLESEQIEEDPIKINEIIRCAHDTPRMCVQAQEALTEIRQKVEKYLKNGYLKRVQAPIGTRPILKAWMEIS
jgi:superfamily II DNA or RNA helicase